jgi:hypothetical protein
MVMADDENSDFVANAAEQKVIREPPQIRSPDITLPDSKRFWLVCGLGHEITKLSVKLHPPTQFFTAAVKCLQYRGEPPDVCSSKLAEI